MSEDRDRQHAGGSIVDTARANMSSEELKKDDQQQREEQKSVPARQEDRS
jgi:hypothetical protein